MRTTKCGEIYISIDTHTAAKPAYKVWEMMKTDSKVMERQRDREGVCVPVLVDTDGSIGQHPQTMWEQESHLASFW